MLVHLADPTARQAVLAALDHSGVQAVDVLARHPGTDLPEPLLAEMLAADAWVGGCSGRDHLWALLRPQAPQLALWPGAAQEQAGWATVQRGLGLSEPWCRWPFNPGLLKILAAAETPTQDEQAALLAPLNTLVA